MTQCNTNFLAPTGFQLDIPGFSAVAFQCVSANIPGISMGGPLQATPLNDFQLSGDKLTYETLTGAEIEDLINKNIYPKNKEDLKVEDDDQSSALGSMGLKPKIVH